MDTMHKGVAVEDYQRIKEQYKEWGLSAEHLIPVDLNGAFVPLEKDAQSNFEKAGCNAACRFGLCDHS